MTEEKTQDPQMVPVEQFNELQAKHDRLEKTKQNEFYTGFVTGSAVAGVFAALLVHNCSGNSNPTYTRDEKKQAAAVSTGDAGAYDAGVLGCSDIKGCYDQKHVDNLNGKLKTCETDRDKYKSQLETCLEDKNECIEERDRLRKRPKSCPTYTPKACPPVKECPAIPYIRKGE